MPSLTHGNFKTAMHAVTVNRWRSLMTIIGIIIGIVSAVTTVSIGEGIKAQVADASRSTGNSIVVRPGQLINRGSGGQISGVNVLPGYASAGTLNDQDVETIAKTGGVRQAVPLSLVNGPLKYENKLYRDVVTIGTTEQLPEVLKLKTAYGDFFTADDSNENGVVIGSGVAREVFGQDVPLGQSFEVLGQSLVVRGVLDTVKTSPLSLETNLNQAVFIPYSLAKDLTKDRAPLYEIRASVTPGKESAVVARSISSGLTDSRGGLTDFTVLAPGETVGVTSNLVGLLTRMITAIAVISLIVGGIGIMNVMLVSVTERLHEIGIRKAIGATSRQILGQFMVEATLLSLLGGIIGIVISLLVNIILRIFTSLTPVIDPRLLLLAVGVSVLIGVLFGSIPALKAARKDPIDALRNE